MRNCRRAFLPGTPEWETVVELSSRELQNAKLSSNFPPGSSRMRNCRRTFLPGAPECETVVELSSQELLQTQHSEVSDRQALFSGTHRATNRPSPAQPQERAPCCWHCTTTVQRLYSDFADAYSDNTRTPHTKPPSLQWPRRNTRSENNFKMIILKVLNFKI